MAGSKNFYKICIIHYKTFSLYLFIFCHIFSKDSTNLLKELLWFNNIACCGNCNHQKQLIVKLFSIQTQKLLVSDLIKRSQGHLYLHYVTSFMQLFIPINILFPPLPALQRGSRTKRSWTTY